VLVGKLLDEGSDALAGTAPCSEEIDNHELVARVLDSMDEQGLVATGAM
jgi:hypothetical protein